jgi:plastocyanin
MKKTFGVILALSLAGLAAAVAVARPAAVDGTLQGTVGPGYSITLTQNGTKVTHLDPGTYTIDVNDQADVHNFHLFGPGVDQSTTVEGTGTATWTVTFQDGATYTYVCDAHPGSMIGKFTVGNVPVTTTAPPPPAALKVRATAKATGLTVSVTATATRVAALDFSLWKGTKRVAHAKAKAKTKTVRLHAPSAGRYIARVIATAGGKTAKTSVAVTAGVSRY